MEVEKNKTILHDIIVHMLYECRSNKLYTKFAKGQPCPGAGLGGYTEASMTMYL